MERHTELSNDHLDVRLSADELVVRARIDRPERRNALSERVIDGLLSVFEFADEAPVRVVVVRGTDGVFCAGGDIESIAGAIGEDARAHRREFEGMKRLIEGAVDTAALTVAAVEGYCLAGGMGLAAACDVIVASEDATFGTPEAKIGLFPAQALVPIMRTVTEKRALKLLFTGEHIDAATAHEIGFVTDLVAGDGFDEALDSIVDDLTTPSPALIALGKEAFYNQREMGFREALDYMHDAVTLISMSDEAEAGIEAFLDGTEPDWKGRPEE
jgi:enoyl-CoA hydratase/carnithine racemase